MDINPNSFWYKSLVNVNGGFFPIFDDESSKENL